MIIFFLRSSFGRLCHHHAHSTHRRTGLMADRDRGRNGEEQDVTSSSVSIQDGPQWSTFGCRNNICFTRECFFQRMAWKRKKNASLNPFATLLSIRKPIQTTTGGRIPMSDANF